MRIIISYTLLLLTFMLLSRCQTSSAQMSDFIFQDAIYKFKEKFPDSKSEASFPSLNDSSLYVDNLMSLLNKELQTTAFDKRRNYSDFSFSTVSYYLTIHEVLLTEVPKKFPKEILKPHTESPLQIQIKQFGNRVLLFSYSPFKLNDSLQQAIVSFENIYEELVRVE